MAGGVWDICGVEGERSEGTKIMIVSITEGKYTEKIAVVLPTLVAHRHHQASIYKRPYVYLLKETCEIDDGSRFKRFCSGVSSSSYRPIAHSLSSSLARAASARSMRHSSRSR